MQMVITVFGLLGVGLAAWPLWISFVGKGRLAPPPRHRAPVLVNGWTGRPMSACTSPLDGPRVQRRGFGTHLAGQPARRRTWSAFAYSGMWAPWKR